MLVGDTEFYIQSERVYYEVQLPKEYGLPNKPMFFSKVRVVIDRQEATSLTHYTHYRSGLLEES